MLTGRSRSTSTVCAAPLAPAPSRVGAFCLERLRIRKLRPGFDAQNGTRFPFEPLAESASRNSAPEWDALSGWSFKRKVHPGIRAWNGAHFPEQPSTGNCVPEFRFRVGWRFRLNPLAESHPRIDARSGTQFPDGTSAEIASQFERLFRDAVSAGRFSRKACPVLGLDSGTRFPLGMPYGRRIPF